MAEIKLHKLTETLYDIAGDKIREFCEKTYYGDIVFSFEQSYNGKEWTKEVEFATFYNGTNLCYESDWNEGQTHLRNLRIWHLEDSEPVIRCKDCAFWQDDWETSAHDPNWHYCSMNDTNFSADEYCSRGERRENADSDTDTNDI